MNKIKVIDLLNMISKGEEVPKKIKFKNKNYNKEFYFDGDIYKYKDDFNEYAMTDDLSIEMALNDEVEIIEEDKKIEHIENYVDFVNLNDSEKFDYLYEMETRIIDYINGGTNGE